jgi:rhodanese-related sulfurtransferase
METHEESAVTDLIASGAHVVDVRDPAAFAAGHFPGAMNVTKADILADPAGALGGLPWGTPVVLVGDWPDGGLHDACAALEAAGYRHVVLYAAVYGT